MTTIKLKVNDKILGKVIQLLSKFKSEDLDIIVESNDVDSVYLKEQLQRLESGSAKRYTLEQLEELLEDTIQKHEN